MTRAIRAVIAKELVVIWATPLPYITGALFGTVLGLLFVDQLQSRQQALVQPLFPLAGFLLVVIVPILSMRSFADEARTGALELLHAIPVRAWVMAVGKWVAVWVTAVAMVVPAAVYAWLVDLYGDPDSGPIVAGFLGLVLLTASLTALGVASSSVTSSVAVAAVVAFVAGAGLWFSGTRGVLAHLSLSERLRALSSGAIDTGDVGFFVAMVVVLLGITTAVVGRRRARSSLVAVVCMVAAVAIDVGTDRTRTFVDLSAEDSLSLTRQTERIAQAIKQPTTVTAFLQADDPERASASSLLLRYQRLNRKVAFRILDPRASLGEVRRLGIDPAVGGAAVTRGNDVELIPTLTEQDVTGALARLERGRSATICVTTGHGESSLTNELSEAAGLLRQNGYELVEVDLLARPSVPAACDGVWMPSPTAPPTDAVVAELRSWLEDEGRLFLQLDPVSTVNLSGLIEPLGLRFERGVVLEADPEGSLENDPTAPIVSDYRSANPIVRRLPPTFFPGVQAVVAPESRPAEGLTSDALAQTSRLSYLETEPLTSDFDESTDTPGPITVAAAVDKSSLREGDVHRSRVVAVGDVDFATNAAVSQAANSTLLVRAFDWLTLDDQLLVLSANIPPYRPLALTRARVTYARFIALGVIPGLFLLLWLTVFVVRRSR